MITDDEMRARLADALWRIDTGGDSPPLAQASSSSHRVYARAATDLLPTVRAIAAAAYGKGRDDEAAGAPLREDFDPCRNCRSGLPCAAAEAADATTDRTGAE